MTCSVDWFSIWLIPCRNYRAPITDRCSRGSNAVPIFQNRVSEDSFLGPIDMSRRMPTVRETTLWASLPHVVVLSLLCGTALFLTGDRQSALFYGFTAYLVWSIGGRHWIPRAHRRGVQFTRKKQWAAAQQEFEASYDFFSRNSWIDRLRFLTMLSSSRVSYREMALLNIATCQLQQKRVAEAKATYRAVLGEFPGSPMAEAALETIETVEDASSTKSDGG